MRTVFMTTDEAADYIGIARSTLEKWRSKSKGPKYCKLGAGPKSPVRYTKVDLDAWIASLKVGGAADKIRQIDIIFSSVPGDKEMYFVEVEDMDGSSVAVGEWVLDQSEQPRLRIRIVGDGT